MRYVLLLAGILGGCDEMATAQAAADARLEVLIPSSGYSVSVPGGLANPMVPMYLRDRVTGICFVIFPWNGQGPPTPVSCGVVQGAVTRMEAVGWDPGRCPDHPKYFLPRSER